MRRSWQRYAWNAMDAFVWVGTIAVVAWAVSQPKLVRPGATVPVVDDVEQAPVIDVAPDPTPDPDRVFPSLVMARAVGRGPLTFSGPDGTLVLEWGVIWDDVSEDCKNKLLALVANRNRPMPQPQPLEYADIRQAEHGAAWRACPEFRR